MSRAFLLAGFQLTLHGRFWVTAEALTAADGMPLPVESVIVPEIAASPCALALDGTRPASSKNRATNPKCVGVARRIRPVRKFIFHSLLEEPKNLRATDLEPRLVQFLAVSFALGGATALRLSSNCG